jgi:hypothetical protein
MYTAAVIISLLAVLLGLALTVATWKTDESTVLLDKLSDGLDDVSKLIGGESLRPSLRERFVDLSMSRWLHATGFVLACVSLLAIGQYPIVCGVTSTVLFVFQVSVISRWAVSAIFFNVDPGLIESTSKEMHAILDEMDEELDKHILESEKKQ